MPAHASTQSTLSIIDVKNDIVVLAGGHYRIVLKVKAINFDLLSEDEQDAIIFAYASLINALEFPLQILVKTRQLNIASYLDYLERAKQQQTSPALRDQLTSYQQFVHKLVVENNVLFKTFYVVIPFDGLVVNKASVLDPLKQILPNQAPLQSTYSAQEFAKAEEKLIQMRDGLMAQFQRIGLKVTQLNNQELIELYYNLYNPEVDGKQQTHQDISDYTTTMVNPAVS
jgi:hypothetical protein